MVGSVRMSESLNLGLEGREGLGYGIGGRVRVWRGGLGLGLMVWKG